ncbi:MAG TPA: F0F1 ATP synthase subunit epsilon [bacterium]|nr:F0F1 ATP synthase subunit epsilon [bacterium]HQG46601.1 F0F1 ATP synthase subunit epsilon [bacterium]HQI49895.1 F0F1 ATP synthase subunit epsilon [bacterium]HQJ63582.1 F0F1 ATP synthase subunit epsilon [bacterium]
MDKTFTLEIVTPTKVVSTEKVLHVKAPGVAGYFGVLHNHAPFLTALKVGVIEARTPAGMRYYATSGGFCEVMENRMKILVETAEAATEIDVERAKQARDRAMARLEHRSPDIDIPRAQAALARAMNRIQVSELH